MGKTGSVGFVRLAGVLAATLSVAGCDVASRSGASPVIDGTTTASAGPQNRVIERDVEAPAVFNVEEPGLWDGRPSLGGVWVAHPSATDPERVVIRNPVTGASVIGALFRRERDNPGPRFQVSSEAATALGILAGAPTRISVTALRLQRVEMEIDPAPEPATAAAETLALAPTSAVAAGAVPASVTPPGAPQGQVEIVSEDAPRRGLRGLFGRRTAAPAEVAIAETTLAPAAGIAIATAQTAAIAPVAGAAAGVAAVEPAPQRRSLRDLFRRRAPEPTPDTTMIALPETTAAPVTPVAAPVAGAPAAARIDRPFVQIGIFSVEQNAVNARAQMQRAGLTAEIRRGRAGDNQFWRVVVGPATTSAERAETLRRVQGLGFADAYAVVR